MGWRNDLPDLFVTGDIVVHNAGGMVVWESAIANIPLSHLLRFQARDKEMQACLQRTTSRLGHEPPSLAKRFAEKEVTDIVLKWKN